MKVPRRTIKEVLLTKRILISDGAWGTFLQAEGLMPGNCPELWNIEHPEIVETIALSYIYAGSDIIETNTFGGNNIKLNHYGLGDRTYELNKAGAEISRKAAGDNKIVIGSIGPSGKILITGEVTKDELEDSFTTQVKGLLAGGVDAFCIETFFDIDEAESALNSVKNNSDLETILTFTFEDKGDNNFYTMMGVTPTQFMEHFDDKVDIIGANCGNGFEGMISIVKEMRKCNSNIPILIHANAGIPKTIDGVVSYPDTPIIMAELLPELINSGANIIGGCCGTTPEHIMAMKRIII